MKPSLVNVKSWRRIAGRTGRGERTSGTEREREERTTQGRKVNINYSVTIQRNADTDIQLNWRLIASLRPPPGQSCQTACRVDVEGRYPATRRWSSGFGRHPPLGPVTLHYDLAANDESTASIESVILNALTEVRTTFDLSVDPALIELQAISPRWPSHRLPSRKRQYGSEGP